MELKRELATHKLYLIENSKKKLETGQIGAEFGICIYTDSKITITKELDESLYFNLAKLLENKYIFNNNLSYQEENKIVWLSDSYCDIDNKEETDKINRLIIEKDEDKIYISYLNPYLKELGITNKYALIAFSPCGNGFYSENLDTGLTFQDDVILTFKNVLENKTEINKVKQLSI